MTYRCESDGKEYRDVIKTVEPKSNGIPEIEEPVKDPLLTDSTMSRLVQLMK